MPQPLRLLRDCVDNVRHLRPALSARELDRQDRILDAAQTIIHHYGRAGLTMAAFAAAIRIPAATIRRHFADIDTILAELIHRHLRTLSSVLGAVPHNLPNRQIALRAAYIEATRTGFGAPIAPHALLLYERHALPPDLRDNIDKVRDGIGALLAGAQGAAALALLDIATLPHEDIEHMLAPRPHLQRPDIQRHEPTPKPAPAPPPAANKNTFPAQNPVLASPHHTTARPPTRKITMPFPTRAEPTLCAASAMALLCVTALPHSAAHAAACTPKTIASTTFKTEIGKSTSNTPEESEGIDDIALFSKACGVYTPP